jgi:hypothetical protein
MTDAAGLLIDEIIGICFTCPEYLRPAHARRHIVLLNELKEFRIERDVWNSPSQKVRLAELPISRLNPALRHWIFSFFDSDNGAIMASYALDTTRFLQFHIEGYDEFHPEHWRIAPILDTQREERDFVRFINPTFKREFTEQMGTLHLSAMVPHNCKVTDTDGRQLLGPGDEFLFNTERCHLSSGVYDHVVRLICHESDNQRFDLHREFRFMGAAFTLKDTKFATKKDLVEFAELDFRGLKMELPAHWIDSIISIAERYPNDGFDIKIRDIPSWEAEVHK